MTGDAARGGETGARATAKDVAAAAGVSTKTVSRVLKGERYVGQETRERVEAAAAALGFRGPQHDATPGPRAGRLVAVFFDPEGTHALPPLLAGIAARAATHGARVAAVPCDRAAMRRGEDPGETVDAVAPMGAILLPPLAHDPALRSALAERGVRTVLVAPDAGDAVGTTRAVGIDGARAGAVMTRHLLALGHRRIGVVGRGDGVRGHRAAMAAAGLDADPVLFVADGRDFAAGARAGSTLMELADPPTAVFAASDTLAAGVLTAAHARGLRVPEDVSVAGFGDEPLAAYVWPPLTTIRIPARALGEAAADLLLGGDGAGHDIGFELVERASVIGIGI